MYRGFDKDGFMAHLHETFNGFENPWLRELVENVISYVEANEDSRDRFAEIVSDLLPEVEFAEVAAFCDDAALTPLGLYEKRKWKEAHENCTE